MAGTTKELERTKAKRFAEIYVYESLGSAANAYKQVCEELGLELPPTYKCSASHFLKKPIVQKYVERYREEAKERFAVDKEEIVNRLKELAFDRDKPDKTALAALKQLTDMGGFAQQNLNIQGAQTYEVVIK